MTGDEIRSTIEGNLRTAGWSKDDLRVQPDPFAGWHIVVVSKDFEGQPPLVRRAKTLTGLEGLEIEWLELLTPSEREWVGALPLDSDLTHLPLWPEALARGTLAIGQPQNLTFPSDLDQDIEPPIIATFYSLRGGVGRSTALAYTGHILAERGRKVVCVDMDLEAPGLAALFGKEQNIQERYDLVHLLVALDQGEQPDLSKYLLRVTDESDLYCLPAGRPTADYARLLSFINPSAWYREERNPLHQLIDQLRTNLPFKPDVILLDARTGIAPFSGPLLFDLADLSVIVFFPHPQTATGTEALVRALLSSHTRRRVDGYALTPDPRFIVSPIPASKAPEVVQRYEHRALEWIAGWLANVRERNGGSSNLVESEITTFIPYRELIATSDAVLARQEVWRDYRPVADWIARFLPTPSEVSIAQSLTLERKEQIVRELRFSTGLAEHQRDLLDTFVETELVKRALGPDYPLVLGRKGTGKTAIFRRLAEDTSRPTTVVTAPARLREGRGWLLSAESFRDVEQGLKDTGAGWRQFWGFLSCLAIYLGGSSSGKSFPLPNSNIDDQLIAMGPNSPSEIDVVSWTTSFFAQPQAGLLTNHWLDQLDRLHPSNSMLLFDGLDTGFGSSEEERRRRREALEGLFTFFTDKGDGLQNFRFKILLREDIWGQLRFENKSHFFGRSVTLKWGDMTSFFKVVLKQALRSDAFRQLRVRGASTTAPVDEWGAQEVISAWNVLVGERMKGGKAAFTRNWVWNRLADGNEDHTPRSLLQLMTLATEWERGEQARSPYDRSVLRPRALIQVLPDVSEQALSALRDEEFPDLAPLLNDLTKLGRTPVEALELQSHGALLGLAREVGLLGIYEGSEENTKRYKVPEIYRYALGMSRRGQA